MSLAVCIPASERARVCAMHFDFSNRKKGGRHTKEKEKKGVDGGLTAGEPRRRSPQPPSERRCSRLSLALNLFFVLLLVCCSPAFRFCGHSVASLVLPVPSSACPRPSPAAAELCSSSSPPPHVSARAQKNKKKDALWCSSLFLVFHVCRLVCAFRMCVGAYGCVCVCMCIATDCSLFAACLAARNASSGAFVVALFFCRFAAFVGLIFVCRALFGVLANVAAFAALQLQLLPLLLPSRAPPPLSSCPC